MPGGATAASTAIFAPSCASILKLCDGDRFGAIRLFESRQQLPNNYVMKVDKASMSVSVEARVPFLDRRIADIAYRTPAALLISQPLRNCSCAAWPSATICCRRRRSLAASLVAAWPRRGWMTMPLGEQCSGNYPRCQWLDEGAWIASAMQAYFVEIALATASRTRSASSGIWHGGC